MPLASGTKLGPYEIQSPLGAGGMGEVYRAKDSRLGRDVAIKVLPESMARDTERLRRFETEARAIAALNHPNILSIHVATHLSAKVLGAERSNRARSVLVSSTHDCYHSRTAQTFSTLRIDPQTGEKHRGTKHVP
jgi:serine/threonine protein kinase